MRPAPRLKRNLHPIVPLAEGIGVLSVLEGAVLLAIGTGWLPPLWLLIVCTLAAAAAGLGFARWRFKRVTSKPRRSAAIIGSIPVALAGISLVAYAVVVGVVHLHLFGSETKRYARESTVYVARLTTLYARLKDDTQLEQLLQREETSALASKHPSAKRFNALVHRYLKVGQQDIATLRAAALLKVPRRPSGHELPRWFGRLQGTFTIAAQVLAALVLALVFSRRAPILDRALNDVFRVTLLVAILGLFSALIGIVPSLPPSAQAILFGYTLAGLLSSASAVFLIAGGWIG